MRILIVEDIFEMRESLKQKLESFGFDVLEAENGSEGLKVLENNQVRFVLSDIQMPIMNGIEFLIKARKQYPTLPIFIMTGYSPYSEQEVLALGATEYYEKLFLDLNKIARRFIIRPA